MTAVFLDLVANYRAFATGVGLYIHEHDLGEVLYSVIKVLQTQTWKIRLFSLFACTCSSS